MNKTKMNGLMTALLITASFAVAADEAYAPADYKPAVDYNEYRSSASSAANLDVDVPPSTEHDTAQNSLQNTAPIAAAESDQAENAASSASKSAESPPVMQNHASAQTKLMPFIGLAIIACGWVLFRRKYAAIEPSSVLRHTEADSAAVSTGVERYVQKMADNKTGVAKYLERQVENVPGTGVAKYLAKQAVRKN